MQMKDSSNFLFFVGGGGVDLGSATEAPRFIFPSGACGCLYTHPLFSLPLFISFPQLTPNPPYVFRQ